MTLSDQALDALLKRLHLANTRRAWRELSRRAEQGGWSYRDFLALVVSEEIAQRQQTRLFFSECIFDGARVILGPAPLMRDLIAPFAGLTVEVLQRCEGPRCKE